MDIINFPLKLLLFLLSVKEMKFTYGTGLQKANKEEFTNPVTAVNQGFKATIFLTRPNPWEFVAN